MTEREIQLPHQRRDPRRDDTGQQAIPHQRVGLQKRDVQQLQSGGSGGQCDHRWDPHRPIIGHQDQQRSHPDRRRLYLHRGWELEDHSHWGHMWAGTRHQHWKFGPVHQRGARDGCSHLEQPLEEHHERSSGQDLARLLLWCRVRPPLRGHHYGECRKPHSYRPRILSVEQMQP